jgi:hypothetical protein
LRVGQKLERTKGIEPSRASLATTLATLAASADSGLITSPTGTPQPCHGDATGKRVWSPWTRLARSISRLQGGRIAINASRACLAEGCELESQQVAPSVHLAGDDAPWALSLPCWYPNLESNQDRAVISRLLCHLSYMGIELVSRAGIEPASPRSKRGCRPLTYPEMFPAVTGRTRRDITPHLTGRMLCTLRA